MRPSPLKSLKSLKPLMAPKPPMPSVTPMIRRLPRVLALAFATLATSATFAMTASAPTTAYAATASPTSSTPLLSPENDDAMLNMLMEDGVQYTTASAADDAAAYSGRGTTLVIDQDETNMSASAIAELASANWGRVIILSYDPSLLQAFAPGVLAAGGSPATSSATTTTSTTDAPLVTPGSNCAQSDATSAGSVVMPEGSESYTLPTVSASSTATPGTTPTSTDAAKDTDLTACYSVTGGPDSAEPAMVSLHDNATGGDVILLGWTDFTENEYLAEQGDAALALGLFGAHGTLVWLATQFTEDYNLNGCVGQACGSGPGTANPSGNPSAGGGGAGGGSGGGGNGGGSSSQAATLAQLIPHWIWWMALQLVLAAVALAYWRSRRLGRLVGENLPVKVRAAETVEGHANLYRRAAAHGRAAGLLRSAAARRIAPLLGLPAGPAGRDPATLVRPVAERLGRPAEQIHAVLAGEAPMTEAELVRLTDQLDRLEQEVRSP